MEEELNWLSEEIEQVQKMIDADYENGYYDELKEYRKRKEMLENVLNFITEKQLH